MKGFCLKSQSGQEIKYTQIPTTCYCSTNITVVGTFLSWHKQLTPISAHKCCKTRGGGMTRSLFVVRLLTAKVRKVCKLAHELEHMICLQRCMQTQTYDMFVCVCVHACIVALVVCHQASVVAFVVMELLPLMHRRLCHCCNGNCCSYHNGIIAIVDAQASLLLSN
jgi:hypothetical protein